MFGKDAMKANDDGTFEVHVMYAPKDRKGYGAMNICVAGGTVGEPTIELHGGVDAG